MPRALPAKACPSSTLSIAALIISAMYAASRTAKAKSAAKNGLYHSFLKIGNI